MTNLTVTFKIRTGRLPAVPSDKFKFISILSIRRRKRVYYDVILYRYQTVDSSGFVGGKMRRRVREGNVLGNNNDIPTVIYCAHILGCIYPKTADAAVAMISRASLRLQISITI